MPRVTQLDTATPVPTDTLVGIDPDNAERAVRFPIPAVVAAGGALLADGSVPLAGDLEVTGTVDGRDVSADGAALDAAVTELATKASVASVATVASDLADLVRLTPTSTADTAITIGDSDNNVRYLFTSDSAVTVTVPSGLTPGTRVELKQRGAGTVTVVAGAGSPTLEFDSDVFAAATNAQFSTITITVDASGIIDVAGDLALAA